MNKTTFLIKLIPSRPDFAQTMTDEEKDIMNQHIQYWQPYLEKGTMIVFGPVLDPQGVYGVGIVQVENEEQLVSLINNDPASKINKYDYYPMMAQVGKIPS